jgi:hypothetical protein
MLKLLVDPRATSAYFADLLEVARAELRACAGLEAEVDQGPTMSWLVVDAGPERAAELVRLSCVHGVFAAGDDALRPIDADPGWRLPAELVDGNRYRGKTNELVTLLAIQAARAACAIEADRLLDPMAGRGTTLLWAARLGMDAIGVEQDGQALADLQRHVKRQTKLQRIKHSEQRGAVLKKNKRGLGQFLEYRFPDAAVRLRLVTGDSRDLAPLVQHVQFPLLVADLPYGIQHRGASRRSPIDVLTACAPSWADALLPGGAMALVFNRFQPSRTALNTLFEAQGLIALDWVFAHRMSESIHRDILVFRKPLETTSG